MRTAIPKHIIYCCIIAGCAFGCAPSAPEQIAVQGKIAQNQVGAFGDSHRAESGIPAILSNEPAIQTNASSKIELREVSFEGIQDFIQSKRGAVVVVDMWATWCPPCVKEFPNLVKLQSEHDLSDLVCVSVSFDHQGIEPMEQVRQTVMEFLHHHKAYIANLLSIEESDTVSRKFGIASIPVIDVYDRNGKLIKRFDESAENHQGYMDIGKLVDELILEQ